MGGDHGPAVVIPALMTVATRRPDIRFVIYGREELVRPELAKFPKLAEVSEFFHCEIAVRMDDKPSQALRHGRWKSSMWKAVEAVKSGASLDASGETEAPENEFQQKLRSLLGKS